jgi:hypothetical protein
MYSKKKNCLSYLEE